MPPQFLLGQILPSMTIKTPLSPEQGCDGTYQSWPSFNLGKEVAPQGGGIARAQPVPAPFNHHWEANEPTVQSLTQTVA